MPRYCHDPPLGTTPNAKIRIRTNIGTLCSSAPCGSVAKTAAKMSKKCDQGDAGALRAGFSLILGLVGLILFAFVFLVFLVGSFRRSSIARLL